MIVFLYNILFDYVYIYGYPERPAPLHLMIMYIKAYRNGMWDRLMALEREREREWFIRTFPRSPSMWLNLLRFAKKVS